ncbi:S8 family serine peptidase [Hyphobacterium marinum]|uniref:S8 family serine peptidase n=1 Tax=Hyphobacterium marinum TaxID=3116574 RepID=A0ABU7LXX6_9PROT|nr:S8 family serine peptidase [Hyphobacterium sp. Y6023]MEE2566412.1 S8 family serine peptidase [Hyphobacterium sp. Y6023]
MFGRLRQIGLILLVLFATGPGLAHGQLPLPVTPPRLPVDTVQDMTRDTLDQTNRTLEDVRAADLRDLLRQNRDVLERGPRQSVIVRREIIAFAPSESLVGAAEALGFRVLRQDMLPGLGTPIVVFEPPERWSTRRALRRLQSLDGNGVFDFNHIYSASGQGRLAMRPPAVQEAFVGSRLRLGIIDTGIAQAHPALQASRLTTRAFGGLGYVPAQHGTQVASLAVGHAGDFRAPAAGAEIFSADVYGDAVTGGNAEALARALGWMAEENVAVINISVVGPPNRILEAVVRQMTDRGHIIVAAVGNDGPTAPPLYPAAYDGVIGVTAVGMSGRVIPEAARGDQVDVAAPGAAMVAASLDGSFAEIRGTSFAAPLVSGLLAHQLSLPDPVSASAAIRYMEAEARDAGRHGRDQVYGVGIMAEAYRFNAITMTAQSRPSEN